MVRGSAVGGESDEAVGGEKSVDGSVLIDVAARVVGGGDYGFLVGAALHRHCRWHRGDGVDGAQLGAGGIVEVVGARTGGETDGAGTVVDIVGSGEDAAVEVVATVVPPLGAEDRCHCNLSSDKK